MKGSIIFFRHSIGRTASRMSGFFARPQAFSFLARFKSGGAKAPRRKLARRSQLLVLCALACVTVLALALIPSVSERQVNAQGVEQKTRAAYGALPFAFVPKSEQDC